MTQPAGYRWIKWALARHLKGPAQGILNVLAAHANAAGESWPSVDTVSLESGCSKSTVQKAIRELHAAGILDVERSRGRKPSTYRMDGAQLALFPVPELKTAKRRTRPAKKEPKEEKPPKAPPAGTPASRFYNAQNGGAKVAAIIDFLTAAGYPFETKEEKGRAAGFVSQHKNDSKGRLWDAIVKAAQSKPDGDVLNLAERIFTNGKTREAERGAAASRARRTGTRDEAAADW